jgi:uncharacterized protein (DUF58 family)
VPIPTRRFAAVALGASALVLLAGGQAGVALLLVDGGLLVAGLVDVLLAPRPATVAVARELPATIGLGETGRLRWRVANPGRRRLTVALADELPPSWRCPDRRARVRPAPRSAATVTRTIQPSRRGRFTIGTMTVRVTGPLGLVSRQADRTVPATLRVYPPFPSRAEAELRVAQARLLEVGLRSATGRGGGTDFEQLREYQVDDETRRLDWAATARAGKPIVRTYRAERNQRVFVLLDTGRSMAATVEGVPRLEVALDAVQAVAKVASRLGDKVAFMAHDVALRSSLAPTSDPDRGAALLEALYELRPRLVETDFAAAFTALAARVRQRSLVLVLTDLAEVVTETGLVPALPLLRGRHLVMVGAVADPATSAWANGPVDGDVGAAYRMAAAERALEVRAQLARRLGRAGVAQVIDAPPRRLAVRLVDAYLEAKAVGRL